ncbi:MAG: M20/M25/M40 family metallo-hydrolase [Woeseiaceae bacterium]|nr:M20/M25/M40 family metallo-hydrolase [Woeseiaceae bacterium]
MIAALRCIALALLLCSPVACTQESADEELAVDILAELIAINTAPSGGNDTRAAVAALVGHLRTAGFGDDEIFVLAETEKLANLVVRYPSREPAQKPLLLMAHLDVVEAKREDWSVNPFVLTEREGFYYGRGATDNKAGAAMLIANFIRLRREGFEPDRDLVIMLTADEESTGNAAQWLLAQHRALVDAEFALNTDGGLVMFRDGAPRAFLMQTAEKIFVSFTFEATDPGGHSSLPRADSAISRLARALVDLHHHRFPIDLNETTRAFLTRSAALASPDDKVLLEALVGDRRDDEFEERLAAAPYYNALARTTCVATQLSGGHAENALPQTARAVVNCRVLPQSSAAAAKASLEELATPHAVTVTQVAEAKPSPPSPLDEKIVGPLSKLASEMWPGIVVIPEMSTGATDGLFVRRVGIPVYGVSAIAMDPDDIRAHGRDERISERAFHDAQEFWYRLVKAYSAR